LFPSCMFAYENDGATIARPPLVLDGFRTYDPFVGGYLQVVDQTWSGYVYAGSNPVGTSTVTTTVVIDDDHGGDGWQCQRTHARRIYNGH